MDSLVSEIASRKSPAVRRRQRQALSLIEVTIALAIVAIIVFSTIVLLSGSLRQTRAIEQEHGVENAVAAVRDYVRKAGFSAIEARVSNTVPIAVVFYGAGGTGGTNWSAPFAGGETPGLFSGGIPQTKVVPTVSAASLQPYVASSKGSPYLVYFEPSTVEAGGGGTNNVGAIPVLIVQALFFRYETLEALAMQLPSARPARPSDFVATVAVPR